jgi:hypothetical protein
MSSPAFIGVEDKDGFVTYINLHTDGSLQWAGKTLVNHYNSQEKAEALVALGNLSLLRPELGERHSFDDHLNSFSTKRQQQWDNWCLSFYRDPRYVETRKGEMQLANEVNELEAAQMALSVEDYLDAAEYEDDLEEVYLFTADGWYTIIRDDQSDIRYYKVSDSRKLLGFTNS